MKKAITLILVTLIAGQAKPQSVDGSSAKSGSSSGWIPIQVTTNRVLVPVVINGHPVTANLVNGITSQIDKGFIDNNNILATNASGQQLQASLTLQFADMTVSQPVNAVVYGHQNSNPPVDLIAGDEVFKEFVVDIDFPNRRIAFYRPDSFIPPTGVTPLVFKQEEVAGHIGLGLLSRCRLIFDYSRDRLYIIPGPRSAVNAPFPKDRSGLVMKKVQDDYVVRYVCPGSPAMKAGFQVGDTVIQVNNQSMPALLGTAWQTAAWGNVHLTDLGTTYIFTLKDKSVRKLTTAEYF